MYSQNHFTRYRTHHTTKNTVASFLHPPSPMHLQRWCLGYIAPILSGVKTEKKIQTSILDCFTSNASFVEFQIVRLINFVRLVHQIGGVLYNSLPLNMVGPYPVHLKNMVRIVYTGKNVPSVPLFLTGSDPIFPYNSVSAFSFGNASLFIHSENV